MSIHVSCRDTATIIRYVHLSNASFYKSKSDVSAPLIDCRIILCLYPIFFPMKYHRIMVSLFAIQDDTPFSPSASP